MRISIIGAGIVGKAIGRGFLEMGHTVWFNDVSDQVIQGLKDKSFNASKEIKLADIYFVCTHEKNTESAVKTLSTKKGLIVIKSTTSPGTTVLLSVRYNVHICHNPEFLRSESALDDFLNPARVVIGECCKEHGDMLEELYKPFDVHIVRTNPTVSELSKLASNSALASSISYWNEIKEIADGLKIDYRDVFKVARLDSRIPRYGLRYTGPFGGRCLPKDLDSIIGLAEKLGVDCELSKAIRLVNKKLRKDYGGR